MGTSITLDNISRDQFSVALSCPGCGQTGFARWEENGPSHNGPQRSLIVLSGGFRQGPKQQQSGDPAIFCTRCDTQQPD
jgi:hypothetical protein